MLDIAEEETKKARALELAKTNKLLAEACAKIVLMATMATQAQLQSALYLSCRVSDDDLLNLMKSVLLDNDGMVAVVNSHHFKSFKARGFVLGPLAQACSIFLSAHLDRWVNGYQVR